MPFKEGIYYHSYGGSASSLKPPLVLIHGAGGNHLYWPTEIRRMRGSQIYALDLPAHGRSGGQARQTIEAYARDVQAWLIELGFPSAVFAGHSMGSAIALELALNYPDCVAGLILVGAGARLRVSSDILQLAESQMTNPNAVRRIIDASFDPSTPAHLKELAARRMAEVRSSVLYADLRACDQFNVIGRLPQIQTPTLVLCGESDQLTPLRYSYYLAEQIPAAQLIVISDAGHMLQLEKPDQVADTMREFLMGIPSV